MSLIAGLRIITGKQVSEVGLEMNRFFTTIGDLINRLRGPVEGGERLASSDDAADELLRQIGERGEPMALPSIVPFLIDDRASTASAAWQAARLLMGRLVPADFIQLDQEMRERSPYQSAQSLKWHDLRPDAIDGLVNSSEAGWLLLGFASFHANGYVRQAAVEKLARYSDGRELPFLLIRLNDWVQPIRGCAQDALNHRVVPGYAPHFVANLALVFNLLERGRDDHRRFVESVLSLLRRPACAGALFAGLKATDRFVSRRSFALITEVPGVDVKPIIEQALQAKDTLIRLWAARKARSRYDGDHLAEFLQVMRRDRFVPVRREALSAYVEGDRDEAASRLRDALLDDHVSMRELAQYHLRKAGNFDFAAFYREALNNERVSLYAAIGGLGETGTAKDAALILPFVSHSSPKVRRAAVQAANRLGGDAYIDVLLDSLADVVPAVSRAARDALKNRIALIHPEKIWRVFNQSPQPHTKRAALFLIAALSKWESLPLLVRACAARDERVAEAAREYVRRWMWRYNLSFLRPSKPQLALLAQALGESQTSLDAKVVEDLRQLVASWK